jgi:putative membrane protein
MGILIRILANSLAIFIASKYVPGFTFSGDLTNLLLAGVVIGLINALVKPIIQLISFPFILLTLGLFNIIINILLLFLATKFIPGLEISTVSAAFWGIIILSLTNYLFSHFAKSENLNKTN